MSNWKCSKNYFPHVFTLIVRLKVLKNRLKIVAEDQGWFGDWKGWTKRKEPVTKEKDQEDHGAFAQWAGAALCSDLQSSIDSLLKSVPRVVHKSQSGGEVKNAFIIAQKEIFSSF